MTWWRLSNTPRYSLFVRKGRQGTLLYGPHAPKSITLGSRNEWEGTAGHVVRGGGCRRTRFGVRMGRGLFAVAPSQISKSFFADIWEVIFVCSKEQICTRLGAEQTDISFDPPPDSLLDPSQTMDRIATWVRWLRGRKVPESLVRTPAGELRQERRRN